MTISLINKRKRYTEEEKAFICSTYQSMSAKEQAIKLNRTYASVKGLRIKLIAEGLIDVTKRKTHRPWTDSEINKLLWLVDHTPVSRIEKILDRPAASIRLKLSKLGISSETALSRRNGMSVGDVANALGVPVDRVRHWIIKSWLEVGQRIQLGNKGMVSVSISPEDLSSFLSVHAVEIQLDPPPGVWRDIVMEIKREFKLTYIAQRELTATAGFANNVVIYWRKVLGFPEPALVLRHKRYYYKRSDVRQWLKEHPNYLSNRLKEALFTEESSDAAAP